MPPGLTRAALDRWARYQNLMLLSVLEVGNMTDMNPLKTSAACAGVAALSYLWAILRGDFMCASNFTGMLIVSLLAFGLAAIIFLVVGIAQRARRIPTND
jgi:hypothetical protein